MALIRHPMLIIETGSSESDASQWWYAAGLDVVKSIHLSLLGPAMICALSITGVQPRLFPTFMMPAAVNVRADAGAIGDGVHDDGPIIQQRHHSTRVLFLPRGIYGVSKPCA